MLSLIAAGIPADEIDALVAFANTSAGPELSGLLLAVIRCARRGGIIRVSDGEDFLTLEEAAETIGVWHDFLSHAGERGEIPVDRVGTERRVRVRDLLAFDAARQRSRRPSADDVEQREAIDPRAADEPASRVHDEAGEAL